MSNYNKNEIIDALNKNVNAFNQFMLSLNKEQFENTSGGKWSAGQNLLSPDPLDTAATIRI
jgi:hypothetical protein